VIARSSWKCKTLCAANNNCTVNVKFASARLLPLRYASNRKRLVYRVPRRGVRCTTRNRDERWEVRDPYKIMYAVGFKRKSHFLSPTRDTAGMPRAR
jgi:hypothetical protein